jgi:hypothetical protein
MYFDTLAIFVHQLYKAGQFMDDSVIALTGIQTKRLMT